MMQPEVVWHAMKDAVIAMMAPISIAPDANPGTTCRMILIVLTHVPNAPSRTVLHSSARPASLAVKHATHPQLSVPGAVPLTISCLPIRVWKLVPNSITFSLTTVRIAVFLTATLATKVTARVYVGLIWLSCSPGTLIWFTEKGPRFSLKQSGLIPVRRQMSRAMGLFTNGVATMQVVEMRAWLEMERQADISLLWPPRL